MIRVLIMIAAAGFLLATVSLSVAAAIAGPELVTRGAWAWAPHHGWGGKDWDWDDDVDTWADGSGPQATRELAWSGGDRLQLDVPAELTFTQAEGPATLTITGPQRAVENVEIENGHIRFDHRMRRSNRLKIVMTAPNVSRFEINGNDRLIINAYRQPSLQIDVSGSGDVTASGQADTVELNISGAGEADLGRLATKGADVDISGAGDATIAPTDWAKLEISGMGDITLLTKPARLETDISGAGSIKQGAGLSPSPSPSPSPSAPPSPSRSKT